MTHLFHRGDGTEIGKRPERVRDRNAAPRRMTAPMETQPVMDRDAVKAWPPASRHRDLKGEVVCEAPQPRCRAVRRHRALACGKDGGHQSLLVGRMRTRCGEYSGTHSQEAPASRPVGDRALRHTAGNELIPTDQAMLAGSQFVKSGHPADPLS